jgi:hypothetical protein
MSWSLPPVLVLGGRRVGLSANARKGPALDVAELMAKDRHRQIGDLGAASQAFPSFCVGMSLTWQRQVDPSTACR